jgi:ABC-type transport system substrate-binding protein
LGNNFRPINVHDLIDYPAVSLVLAHNGLDMVAERAQEAIARLSIIESAPAVPTIALVQHLDELPGVITVPQYLVRIALKMIGTIMSQ